MVLLLCCYFKGQICICVYFPYIYCDFNWKKKWKELHPHFPAIIKSSTSPVYKWKSLTAFTDWMLDKQTAQKLWILRYFSWFMLHQNYSDWPRCHISSFIAEVLLFWDSVKVTASQQQQWWSQRPPSPAATKNVVVLLLAKTKRTVWVHLIVQDGDSRREFHLLALQLVSDIRGAIWDLLCIVGPNLRT